MTQIPQRGIWFPVKSQESWFWDLPQCWQGWTVVIGWWIAMFAGAIYFMTSAFAAMFPVFVVLMAGLLLAVCYVKGERRRR